MLINKNLLMTLWMLLILIFGGCGEGGYLLDEQEPGLSSREPCEGFPLPPGESWTYRVTYKSGRTYTYTDITEKVDEPIGGYVVYRVHTIGEPPGSGDYIGCHPDVGEFLVATTSYTAFPPDKTGESVKIHLEIEPQEESPLPRYFLVYGTPVGKNIKLEEGNAALKVEVMSYEYVTVPGGTFKKVMKIKMAIYENGKLVDSPLYSWIDPEIGIIKGDSTGNIVELIEYKPPGSPIDQSLPDANRFRPAFVVSTMPPSGATVPANTPIEVKFNAPVKDCTIAGKPAKVSYKTAKIDDAGLAEGEQIVTIEWTNKDGSKDSFSVIYWVKAPDFFPPVIVSSSPEDGDADVPIDDVNANGIEIKFNEEIGSAALALTVEGEHLKWIASIDDKKVTLIPLKGANLEFETEYVIEGTVKDLFGHELKVKITFATEAKK